MDWKKKKKLKSKMDDFIKSAVGVGVGIVAILILIAF